MNIKSIAFSGLAVLVAVVMSLGLMAQPAKAAVTLTTAGNTALSIFNNGTNGTGTFTALGANIVIQSGAAGEIGTGNLLLVAPTGTEWDVATVPDAAVTGVGATLAVGTVTVTASTITIPITTASAGATDILTVGGVTKPKIRVQSNTSVTAGTALNILSTGSTATVNGITHGTTSLGTVTPATPLVGPYTTTLQMVSTTAACGTTNPVAAINNPSVPADGSTGLALCAQLRDANSRIVSGAPISFSVSLGVVSTGSSKTTTAFTNTGGNASTNYRGGGNIAATDTAIASNTSYNTVGTLSVSLTVPTGNTASKVVVNAPSILAIAATVTNTSPNYQSPNTGADGAIQVTDSAGLGVNGQVVLITVDRGAIVANTNFGTAIAAACAGATSKSITGTTASGPATRGAGTNTAGIVSFTVCGSQTDAAGKLTITAQNVSTSMANATTSISMAGRPAKVEATATGNAISAKVTDAGGNNVADGTPVRFTISANAGAVSTACTTTTNGQASSVVALIAATGTVIVSTDWNETGAASTCGAAGAQQAAASVTVPGGTASSGTPSTPSTPSAGSVTSGSVPAAGGFGFFVYGGPVSGLAAATSCPAGTAAFWATVNGEFVTNVPGTTISAVNAAFNAAFPNGIPAGTALLGKCK